MLLTKKPIVWTISGADCSGGAGIAADIRTAQALSVEVCHLITANTVQNSQKLYSVNATEIEILQQQVDALINDKPPSIIKIGLIVNQKQLNWLSQTLPNIKQALPDVKVIYDPVGQASVGGALTSLTLAQLKPFLGLIDVITPNLNEAKILANGQYLKTKALAQQIAHLGVNTVIIKGGHKALDEGQTTSIDYCFHQRSEQAGDFIEYRLSSPRINSHYSHGGGCSFASAFSAFLAHGYLVRDAFTLTKAFINKGIVAKQGFTDYYGAFEQTDWPKQVQYFPEITDDFNKRLQLNHNFGSLGLKAKEKVGLYPVVDSIDWLESLLPLNLNIIQLRLKKLDKDELESTIIKAINLSRDYQCRLFINDHWQLAIKHNAYGVHIGQEDLQRTDLKAISKAGLRLGISTHGCYEFLLAQQLSPSYLAIGAIFPTQTKDMTGQIQGLNNLQHLLTLRSDIPVVAIGGINLERAGDVWKTGVDGIAVVTAITKAKCAKKAVSAFNKIIA